MRMKKDETISTVTPKKSFYDTLDDLTILNIAQVWDPVKNLKRAVEKLAIKGNNKG